MKYEVDEIKQSTQSILKAIKGLATKLENSIVNDRLTSVTRQINSKELCITESLDSLQSVTDRLKTSLDQKSCQILNKTTAVFDKVKAHTETLNKITNNPQARQNIDRNKSYKNPNETDNRITRNNVNTNTTNDRQIRKPKETAPVKTLIQI